MKYPVKLIFAIILVVVSTRSQAQFSLRRDNSDKQYQSALAQVKSGHINAAITILTNLLAQRSDYIDAKVMLAKLYGQQGDYTRSIQMAADAIKESPSYQEAYTYIVNGYLKVNKPTRALAYVQRALVEFPGNRPLLLKRLGILEQLHSYPQADEQVETLYSQNYSSAEMKKLYVSHYQAEGDYYASLKNPGLAKKNYNKAMLVDPQNAELLNSLMRIDTRSNDYDASLTRINAALVSNPTSYYLLVHKLSVLQDMRRYADALDVLATIQKYYPADAKAQLLSIELKQDAAGYYSNTDPQDIYQAILDKHPGDMVALNKVIGMAITHDAHRQALYYINQALKKQPGNMDLLRKKMDMEEYDHNYTDAADIGMQLYKKRPTVKLSAQVQELKSASGRYYLGQQQVDLALAEFDDALKLNPENPTALNGKISALLQENDRTQAVKVINEALKMYPGNKKLLILKSGILQDAGDPDAAVIISTALRLEMPADKKVNSMFTEQQLASAKVAMDDEDYTEAKTHLESLLAVDPSNKTALNYMVNLLSAMKQYEPALYYVKLALTAYPDDKEFLLKKTSLLSTMGRYQESAQAGEILYNRYPYNTRYKASYTDALLMTGKSLEKIHLPDSALHVYTTLLAIKPADTLASVYAINLLMAEKQYPQALAIANRSLEERPENEALLFHKLQVLEDQKEFVHAALFADSLKLLYPKKTYIDYADMLNSKVLKNQFGVYFLNTSYETATANGNYSSSYDIATIDYRRFFKRGSFAARINFAGREQGSGLQGEGELYFKYTNSLYSYAVAGFSNNIVFPKIRVAYSLFKTIKPEIEVELGVRYLQVQSFKYVSFVTSVGKTFGDFLMNLRGYNIREANNNYYAFALSARYTLNEHHDFISLTAGTGTSPDDRSRLLLYPQLVGLLSRSIGAGYQKIINYKTTLGINYTYYNQRISTTGYQNQNDLYITLQRRF